MSDLVKRLRERARRTEGESPGRAVTAGYLREAADALEAAERLAEAVGKLPALYFRDTDLSGRELLLKDALADYRAKTGGCHE